MQKKPATKFFELKEFYPYLIIGTVATIIDWSVFSLSVTKFQLHYQTALLIAYTTAAITHYIANKLFTFKCKSKQLGSQLSVYITVTGASLLCSMGIIALFVSTFGFNKILSRMLTTGIMIVPNYLLHKHITFSKKIFSSVH
jgi:putative flippase GtrA